MFAKLLTALVLAVIVGAAVFNLRQQRLELMHEITVLHRQMNQDRQATWDSQVRIAGRTGPGALHDAMERTGVLMEPAVTQNDAGEGAGAPLVNARHE